MKNIVIETRYIKMMHAHDIPSIPLDISMIFPLVSTIVVGYPRNLQEIPRIALQASDKARRS